MISRNILLQSQHLIHISKNLFDNPHPDTDTCFSFSFLQSGRCRLAAKNKSFYLDENTFCVLPPGSTLRLIPDPDCCLYQILIAPDLLEWILSLSFDNNIITQFMLQAVFSRQMPVCLVFLPRLNDSAVFTLVESMYRESILPDAYSDRLLFHQFMSLLCQLLRSYQCTVGGQITGTAQAHHTAIIARYMIQNFDTASLAGLADQLNYSLSYCSRFVAESTGLTFKQLQKKLRMQKAVSCLLYTDMHVNSIAELLGYGAPENFMKVFKKEYGITPTEYRQKRLLPSC